MRVWQRNTCSRNTCSRSCIARHDSTAVHGAGEWTARHIEQSRSRGAMNSSQFPGLFVAVCAVWDRLAGTPNTEGGHSVSYTHAD